MDTKIIKDFLSGTDDTGRFVLTSTKTGIKYFIEPISKLSTANWGSIDPITGKMVNKKGFDKHKGAITHDQTMITEENGFKNITLLEPGVSPISEIQRRDAKHFEDRMNGK